jgi:hypothetical protein
VIDPAANGAGVLFPEGPRYRAIVIDERALPAAVAERLADEAAQGLAVVLVGDLPAKDTGLNGSDARVQAAIARLIAEPTVARVATQAQAATALAQLRVVPAAKWSAPAQVYTQHRETADADYFYVYNATNDPVSIDGSFATTGRPYTLNLWTGAVDRVAAWSQSGGRTTVPLRLKPLGTTVLAFRKGEASPARHVTSTDPVRETVAGEGNLVELRDTNGGARTVRFSDGTTATVTLPALPAPITPAAWKLHVDGTAATGTTPYALELTELKDWRQLPQLATASGVGTYTTTVQLPDGWTAPERGTYLDHGAVAGSVKVFVNGTRVAPDSVAGRDWDVSGHLKPGANELEVVLSTPLGNTVRPAESEPYGLLGPVQLVPFGRGGVNHASTEGTVGGTVPATLSLSLGGAATFGAFQPGVERTYETTTSANVVSTAGDAALSVSEPGRLVNGSFTLAEPLQVAFSKATWTAPVSNDPVTITFRQHIAADQPLRTGTYSRAVTFTLSTTTP